MSELLYKIMPASLWARAGAEGRMPWAPIDVADGFVHLSAASQVRETLRKHFAGQHDLVLIEVRADALTAGTLRWEISRGGALFPHVYGDVPLDAIAGVTGIAEDDEGGHLLPDAIP
jgi:uncharacterized protein (DUF952 family)